MNSIDLWLFGLLNASAHSPAWRIALVAEYSEHMPSLVIGSMLLCWVVGTPRLRKGIALCLAAMLVAWCLTRLIRWGFPLERPYETGLGQLWIKHGARPRFPSLHASVAFAFACGVSAWCSWGRWPQLAQTLAWAAAVCLGASRVYLGVHLPFDILAGLAVGALSVALVQQLRQRFKLPLAALGKFAAYWYRRVAPWAHRR